MACRLQSEAGQQLEQQQGRLERAEAEGEVLKRQLDQVRGLCT